MYSIHIIHVSMLSTVICDIQRFQDGTFIADFIVINKGRMLYPSIVMIIEDLTRNECTEYCIKHLDCVTFNYHLRTRACELVDQNFDEYEALVDDPNWYNYGTPDKIDGKWTYWMNTSCSVTCGNGTLTQYRTCSNPETKYGGAPCAGNEFQTISCNTGPCPSHSFVCTPKYDDEPCIGNEVQTVSCNTMPCPIDGGLSNWIDDGQCSVTCGGGTLRQKKICTNPSPQYGGKPCTGLPTQTVTCNAQDCPCVKTVKGTCCIDRKCTWSKHYKEYVCHDGDYTRTCKKQSGW